MNECCCCCCHCWCWVATTKLYLPTHTHTHTMMSVWNGKGWLEEKFFENANGEKNQGKKGLKNHFASDKMKLWVCLWLCIRLAKVYKCVCVCVCGVDVLAGRDQQRNKHNVLIWSYNNFNDDNHNCNNQNPERQNSTLVSLIHTMR